MEIPTVHISQEFIATEAFPNLYLVQPITDGQYQPTGDHVSNPTDNPTANKQGLFSSLANSMANSNKQQSGRDASGLAQHLISPANLLFVWLFV